MSTFKDIFEGIAQQRRVKSHEAFLKRTRNYTNDLGSSALSPHHDVLTSLGMKKTEDTPSGNQVYTGKGMDIVRNLHAHMKQNGFTHHTNPNGSRDFIKDGHKISWDYSGFGDDATTKMYVYTPTKSKVY